MDDLPSETERTTESTPPTDYYERKIGGWCTYGQCPDRAAPDHRFCYRHKTKVVARDLKAQRARRKYARSKGLCGNGCGTKSETYFCLACRIRAGDPPSSKTERTAESMDKAARIAAATSRRNEGRNRFRGHGARGQRSHGVINLEEVGWAASCLDAFRAGVTILAGPDAQLWRRAEKESVVSATVNQGERVIRHLTDVIERLSGPRRMDVKCSEDEHVFEPGALACACGDVAAPDAMERQSRGKGKR